MDGINFKFFLNFKNDSTGLIEITEAVKFDGASFTLEQEKGRYGRDVSFGNEEVSLVFYDGLYDVTANPLQLPDGYIVYNLTMGLPFLLDYYKTFGFESEVEFIIEKDGVTFTVGILDFQLAKTDQLTFLETKIIQETKRALIKRRSDTKVDVFSDKNLDLETITPLTTTNILLKAKPVVQISEWKSNTNTAHGLAWVLDDNTTDGVTFLTGANNSNVVLSYGIDNTLSYISNEYTLVNGAGDLVVPNDGLNYTYVEAKEELTDVTFEFRNLNAYTSQNIIESVGFPISDGSGRVRFLMTIGTDYLNPRLTHVLYSKSFGYVPATAVENLPTSFDLTVPLILRGERVWIYLEPTAEATFSGNPGLSISSYNVNAVMVNLDLKMRATSTAINSVIKGVRYVDLFKQNVLSMSGMTVEAPRLDAGGEHYEQFAFNGLLIRQFENKPFYTTFKELTEGLAEINADYQIVPNGVYIGQYPDFYPNKDLGGFLQVPFDDFTSEFSERATLVNVEMKYKTYELDRESSNTIDGVHTEAQWLMPNKLVETVKKIDIPQIRDPFAIESARRMGIATRDTTSLDSDDKIYLIDVVPIVDGVGGFSAYLSQRIDPITGFLQILNSDGISEGTFNWELLGFEVGDTFKILNGANIGWYDVQAIEPTLLTISAGGGSFSGNELITVEYPLTNVEYVNRTNEGFTLIENLASGDNFSNLRYTIRRNLIHWESYLATASKYKPNGIISNTYFKNNGLLRTQFGSGTIYQEEENINVASLNPAILSPLIYKTKVVVDFETIIQLLEDLNAVNFDNSIGGFFRIADTNGRVLKLHPTKLDYEWSTNLLTITGEQRNESDFVTINTLGTTLVEINEVGYNTTIISNEWYKINGNFVSLFDANSIPLINPTRIDKIKVNGILYTNGIDLAIALSEL